ncbi:hypothetical protein D3C78_654570 [compost metagenome]
MAQLHNSVTASQCQRIFDHLKDGNSITAIQALDLFGCNRLAARIADLRNADHEITTTTIIVFNRDGGKCRVAEYRLADAGGAV